MATTQRLVRARNIYSVLNQIRNLTLAVETELAKSPLRNSARDLLVNTGEETNIWSYISDLGGEVANLSELLWPDGDGPLS